LRIDPSAPAITFDGATFPAQTWYPHEDKAALPLQGLILTIATFAALRRGDARQRLLAASVIIGVLLYIATFKWQPWGNRLVLFLVVAASPLAGIWLERLLSSARRSLMVATVITLVVASLAGWLSAGYGYPRRLVGGDSVFVLDDWSARFVQQPALGRDYAAVAAAVRASGARRIGLAQTNDSWEYPWWVAFRGRQVLMMQTLLPERYAFTPRSGIDALVCTAPANSCTKFIPRGWTVTRQGPVLYALPPTTPR
jgi:hypothetical protein